MTDLTTASALRAHYEAVRARLFHPPDPRPDPERLIVRRRERVVAPPEEAPREPKPPPAPRKPAAPRPEEPPIPNSYAKQLWEDEQARLARWTQEGIAATLYLLPTDRCPTRREIRCAVALGFGIESSWLMRHTRVTRVVIPRHVAMAIMTYFGHSRRSAALEFGMDHTNGILAERRYSEMVSTAIEARRK